MGCEEEWGTGTLQSPGQRRRPRFCRHLRRAEVVSGREGGSRAAGGSERQACYHELKSLKPPLGFFLATGTAVLVDGSSSAARFVAAGLMYLPTPWR